jgi:hypothetical protein
MAPNPQEMKQNSVSAVVQISDKPKNVFHPGETQFADYDTSSVCSSTATEFIFIAYRPPLAHAYKRLFD